MMRPPWEGSSAMSSPNRRVPPPFASDEWMFEQQVRAELEAEAWRRLRAQTGRPALAADMGPAPAQAEAAPAPRRSPIETGGSAILKAIVRFAMAAAGAFLAFVAALDGGLGEFEIWLAVGASFLVVLALSMFDPLRRMVYYLAETARWMLILALLVGLAWLFTRLAM